jgi:hypothetical protein
MKAQRLAVGLFAVAWGLSLANPGAAQVNSNYQQGNSTTTTTYFTNTMQQPRYPLSGQVQAQANGSGQGTMFWNKEIIKTVTLEPGFNQMSLDHLHWGDRISLTLVNPTNVPLQFETVQRWGTQRAVVVPPHSQQFLSYTHSRPFTHEEKFNVMGEPNAAISDNQTLLNQQAASTVPQYSTATTSTNSTETTTTPAAGVMPPSPQETRSSTVRGYW